MFYYIASVLSAILINGILFPMNASHLPVKIFQRKTKPCEFDYERKKALSLKVKQPSV